MAEQLAPSRRPVRRVVTQPLDSRQAPVSRWRCPWLVDLVAVSVLAAMIGVVHDVRGMITAPYWLDESWVALSVRLPLRELPLVTSTTPIGWTFLLRLVPDEDVLRVVPLAFHVLSVVTAYALGRQLAWPTRVHRVLAGVVCGAVVLLLPAQQNRHDLKQYTADAAVTVGLLALAAWTEQSWSRRRLAILTGTVAVGMLLSHVTAIAAVCVTGGLVLGAAATLQWRRLLEAVIAGAVSGLVVGAVYVGISGRNRNASLNTFWAANFPTIEQVPHYLRHQIEVLRPAYGAPKLVVLLLLLAGVATLAVGRRPGTAIAVLLLPVTATALGVARIYPLLEQRTGHFLLVAAAAVAGIGLVGTTTAVETLIRRAGPRVPRPLLAAGLCAVLVTTYAVDNRHVYRTSVVFQDSRAATRYVAAHRAPGDVVVGSQMSHYGVAFYLKTRLELTRSGNTVGWVERTPDEPNLIFVGGRNAPAIRQTLEQALRLADSHGPGTRVWLIRSHVIGGEPAAWREVLADYRVELVTGGVEPVALVSRR